MRDKFEWEDEEIENPPVASLADVIRIENEIGFKLPPDYIEVARHHQGQSPTINAHDADGKGSCLGGLYHFHGELNSGRLGWGDIINEGADTLMLAFSRDGGGNFFAFDYGDDPQNENPTVVFWDHETGNITKLASSFTEFLGQLKELE